MDYEKIGRLPVDPRVVKEIQGSPDMSAEQGAGFLGFAGGAANYQQFASLPYVDRLTYAAVLEGNTTADAISTVTDLKVEQVEGALTRLQDKGLVAAPQQL